MPLVRVAIVVLGLLWLSACLPSPNVTCSNGTVCSAGSTCVELQGGDASTFICASPAQLEACASIDPGEPCTTPEQRVGTCVSAANVCIEDICGDGVVARSEVCDDGNLINDDGCSRDCQSNETCGNGIVDGAAGEECDSGPAGQSGDGCTSGCKAEARVMINRNPPQVPARRDHRMVYDSRRGKVVLFGGTDGATALPQTWEFDGLAWTPRTFLVSPSPRTGHQLVYDSTRNLTILFGGLANGVLMNDTWAYDGVSWQLLTPLASPLPIRNHAMAYDSALQRVVLFGGQRSSATELDETWIFDGATWTQITGATRPSARTGAAMVFDTFRDKTVLFGGLGMGGQVSDETWQLTGNSWARATVTGAPPARNFHAMSYDSVAHVVVMTGGASDLATELSDIWRFDGSAWRSLPLGPSARARHAMAFDSHRHRTVFFAGLETLMQGPFTHSDMWTFDLATSLWTDLRNLANPKPILLDSAMAFDSERGVAVLFGGAAPPFEVPALSSQTWEFDGEVWRARALPAPTRTHHAMVFDSVRHQIVMFGGSSSLELATATDETMILKAGEWQPAGGVVRPAPRFEHAMAFDVLRGRTVMFGGTTNTVNGLKMDGETWTYDTAWSKLAVASGPPARAAHAMAYDAKRDRVVMFGGRVDVNDEPLVILNDTWEYDGTTWTPWLPPANSVVPSPRIDAAMAFDAKRGVIVLFGGQTEFGPSNEVWEFDGVRWTRQLPLNATVPSAAPLMTFDTLNNNVLLLAGATFVDDLRSYTFRSEYPAEQCVTGTDVDNDGLSVCADPDCFGRCFPTCSATYSGPCDRLTGPRCGDGDCNADLEDYLLCPGDCPP